MAVFRLEVKSYPKGKAEPRSCYINRHGLQGVTDLVVRGHFNMPSFATNRPRLFWSAADKFERSNGSAGRGITISLPNVFSDERNITLTHRLAHHIAGPRPCEFVLHRPKGSISGTDHPHAHIMISDRGLDGVERPAEQFFSRANSKDPTTGGARKLSGGKTSKQMALQLHQTKAEVASIINEVLAESGFSERVDHRSNKERGILKAPEKRLHPAAVRQLSEQDRQLLIRGRRKWPMEMRLPPEAQHAGSV